MSIPSVQNNMLQSVLQREQASYLDPVSGAVIDLSTDTINPAVYMGQNFLLSDGRLLSNHISTLKYTDQDASNVSVRFYDLSQPTTRKGVKEFNSRIINKQLECIFSNNSNVNRFVEEIPSILSIGGYQTSVLHLVLEQTHALVT